MWTLDKSGNLEIFGTGAMANFGTDSTPRGSGIRTVTVKEGVTSIGQNAFAYCTKLSYIDLPEGVVSIGQSAFAGCTGLMTVVTRQGLTSVGTNAFMGCSKLRGYVLPASLESIGKGAFSGCIGNGLYYIGNETDWERINGSGTCGYPSVVDFAAAMDELAVLRVIQPVGESAFTYSGVKTLEITDGAVKLEDSAFEDCDDLESVTFGNFPSTIGVFAFYDCESLATVALGGVTGIGKNAFKGCKGIQDVALPNELQSIGDEAFRDCIGISGTPAIPESVTFYAAFYDNDGKMTGVDVLSTEAFTLGYVGEVSVPEGYNSCTLMTVTSDNSNLPLVPAVSVTAGN